MHRNWTLFLQDILPPSWQWEDRDAFLFHDENGAVAWKNTHSAIEGDELRETYESAGLALDLTLRKFSAEQAAVYTAVIKNTGTVERGMHRLQPLDLLLSSPQGPLHFRSIGGGENVKHYPPEIFNVSDMLCDGVSGIWREHGWGGRSSEKTLPLLGLELNGGALVAGLEWSGLWWAGLNGADTGCGAASAHLFIHIPVNGLRIRPGEALALPAAHVVFSAEGLAGAGNRCRQHIARNVLPPLNGQRIISPPVVYNHWFGLGPNINESVLMAQADAAAKIGAEYFVLDAGWYGGCQGDDFQTGVGNWEVIDEAKFPRGLKPLARHVRAQGLGFGIWIEPERAHVKSDWYRRHPEWFLRVDTQGNDSYAHIDLSNPAARDGVVKRIDSLINELEAKWVKWDYNIDPKSYWLARDASGRLMFDYINGLYEVQQTLCDRHPDVMFECCASGGRRIDLGLMRRTHAALLSDSVASSQVCRFMQQGANCFLPASYLGVGLPFGGIDTHPGGREVPLGDVQLLSRMMGIPVIYGDIASCSEEQRGILKKNIAAFKTWRHLLNRQCYELLPQPFHQDDYAALEFVCDSGEEAVILVFSGPRRARYRKKIHPVRLDAQARYSARIVGGPPLTLPGGSGRELMETGWDIALEPRQGLAVVLTAR